MRPQTWLALWEVRGSLFLSHHPATLSKFLLHFLVLCLVPPSPSLSLSLSLRTHLLLCVVCCQLKLHFLHGSYLFLPPTASSLFIFDSSPSLPRFLPSNLLTPCNLSCLISLFPATFSSTILLIFFSFQSSQLCASLSSLAPSSSLSVSLAMLSTKEVISPPWL